MSRVFNFSAGPAALAESVLVKVRDELLEWGDAGVSVMEMSHRSKEFVDIAECAETTLRVLLEVPENYKILFLQGGATGQFSMVPMNLLNEVGKADYINTGQWSIKAIKEAKRLAEVNIAASSENGNFTNIPEFSTWTLQGDASYVHYTPNETIGGVEFHWVPDTGNVPLVADMSSTLLSRPIDVSKFGIIYAGAQKNIGPAGLTVVIIRKDLIGRTGNELPSTLDYAVQANADSMANTPPTFAWYVAGKVFKWLQDLGGLGTIAEINERKANKLYQFVDGSGGFYNNPVDLNCRSWMNIPFTIVDDRLDETFLTEAKGARLYQLKGHRSVGGMRASIYNAMPEEGIDALIEFMTDFQNRKG